MPANGNPEQGDNKFFPVPVLHGLDFIEFIDGNKNIIFRFQNTFQKA